MPNVSPRYPNQVPKGQRNTMWRQDAYESGPIRDGHRLYREEDDADGWTLHLEHPTDCPVLTEYTSDRDGTTFPAYQYHDCPWTYLVGGSLQECYELGEDALPLDRLPLYEEVEIWWAFQSGATWTDYGWEHDASLGWWFGHEPEMRTPEGHGSG